MDAARDSESAAVEEEPPRAAEEERKEQEDDENEILIAKAQALIDKITSNPENPNPNALHALSTILEAQESRYMEETGHLSTNNGRSSHNVGRLGNLIRDNDEFFELISSKFLVETTYSVPVQAAAMRLLFDCSLTWKYPHVFEEDVLDNLKGWVMEETPRTSVDDHNWKHESGRRKNLDSEMLRTYSTGLLAVCLASGGQIVEDVLTSGLSAKLMRHLRIRVLGETSTVQKDANSLIEHRGAATTICAKTREEGRGRLRQVPDSSHVDVHRIQDDGPLDGPDRDHARSSGQAGGDERWIDEEPPDRRMAVEVDDYEAEADGEEKWHIRDLREAKTKPGGKYHREEDLDENLREDSSRRRLNRGPARSRGKGRVNEGVLDNEQVASPVSGSRLGQGRSGKDRSLTRSLDLRRTSDAKKGLGKNNADAFVLERDDDDDCFQECKVGSKDIADVVKKAVRAAEAEARAANAPAEAIKAAGDSAAEVVKSAALEEFKKTNNDEAAMMAASRAASTVIDAANTVAVSRGSSSVDDDSGNSKPTEPEPNEDIGEFLILDSDSLGKLREKFCIQCLVILGEYVEVLGPVLHEKGVDVCLALLQRSFKHKEASNSALLLPDILKLICALAAHRKFAALFVDRGGMQKLLSVPRVAQTFFGLSSCLFTIGSIQGIMERVCALPSNVVHQVVELALKLLECPQDQARKNAALFFAAAFVFRAVIDAFDAQDGLQNLLDLLRDAASVRSGVPSGTLNNSGSLRNDRSTAEVLTSSEKQIAYHTCVALRQYFRAHLLLLVDSIRPNKNIRSATRNISSARAAYKPLDLSNEAMDAVFRQIQKDRKLGPAFVRARWPVVDKFLSSNGHVTMLELCQAPPVERYLHDLLQYALGVLRIVTLIPYSRKLIVNATLSNDRVGIAVILDAANGAGYVEPEIVEPALNVLINLVCPPPSISNKPSIFTQGQQNSVEQNNLERAVNIPGQNEPRERNEEPALIDRSGSSIVCSSSVGNTSQAPASTVASGLVGDRRISLGGGAGCAGLAAQLEQGYHQAREAVRANNGIKVLLQLLQPRMVTSPAALDCLRALTCRVLLGLARDDSIAHILTKLQVGKKLSELIRDSGSQTAGSEQNRWLAELVQVTIELIGVVTNSGRASTLAASDATTPTLRRIERAAIAAATPITYDSRELLLLIHEHLHASGLAESAATLLKEAQLTPLPSLAIPTSGAHQASVPEASSIQIQWPSGRAPRGFLSEKPKISSHEEDSSLRCDSAASLKKKPLTFSALRGFSKTHAKLEDLPVPSNSKLNLSSRRSSGLGGTAETPSVSVVKSGGDGDAQIRTPIVLPMKRKLTDLKETGFLSPGKRLNTGEQTLRSPVFPTPNTVHRNGVQLDANAFCTPSSLSKDHHGRLLTSTLLADVDENQYPSAQMGQASSSQHGLLKDPQPSGSERLTLDSVVVQYLKHQHRQCPAPITTLPPLSLLHPHVCPESRRSLDAPSNVTARLTTREFRSMYGGIHGSRKDRQFVYSRFRPWRTCRDDVGDLLTCITFLGDSSQIAVGNHSGELKVFDSNSNSVLESCTSHQSPLTLVQSHFSGETQLVLSSSANDVRLWDAPSISAGPRHSFEGCKAARFSNSGSLFAALSSDSSQYEILLYDVQTSQLDVKLTDTSSGPYGRGHAYSLVHFSPSDSLLLWNGVLWDRRSSSPIRRFDQFTDYGGGGFHPAGNEVIINSEVWDLRNFRLLRSVPSLDQTVITFNASGDVIYAILRRNLEDVTSAFNTRRVKHPLFAAFRTVDAVNYSDIATIPVDRCVLDFATEPTDSFVGVIAMDDQDEMYSSARVYEIGRRKPTDDDSDPDDAESEEDEDDDGDDDSIMEPDIDEDGDSDADDISNDDDSVGDFEDDEEDGDFIMDGIDFGGGGILEIMNSDEDDDSEVVESFSSGDEDLDS
ncbi:DDB1- and CUL4-associated factor-like protein 1 [Forsythia ovata]|uniref:DDB1- and CUL4-associated factor-like protein 1 n=1 Tax=Forsythia ovata TaxID=205694 RepID=A0ABD1RPV1_9LAMI